MTEHAEHAEHEEHHHPNYVKVWAILVVLLVVSVLGPELGIQWVTLVTAFGIAVVKAYMVVTNFMHINIEARWLTYLIATCTVFMLLFFAGTSPDVMKATGDNWEKPAWIEAQKAHAAGGGATPHH